MRKFWLPYYIEQLLYWKLFSYISENMVNTYNAHKHQPEIETSDDTSLDKVGIDLLQNTISNFTQTRIGRFSSDRYFYRYFLHRHSVECIQY